MLIALARLPGAGKSTLAKALQARLRAELVSRDAVRMSEFPSWDDRAAKRAAFEVLRLEVCVLLKAGATVIVDGATLSTRAERRELRTAADGFGVPFLLLWLDVPAEDAALRIAGDAHDAPGDRTPALAHEVERRFERPGDDEVCIRLDARLPPCGVLGAALRAVAQAD